MGTNKPSEEQTWEEAGYSNNYVFKMTMDDEDLCKELLECLLNLKISKIVIKQHEKEIETSKESHGVRLDIHIVDFDGIIYDIEMQTGEYSADYFAKRARYYQSMLDQDVLKKGNSYTKLKRTIVIFICTFDPFEYNLSKYTLKTTCMELPAIPINDEAVKIFFNAVGNNIGLTNKQKAFLNYVANNVVSDDFTKKIAQRVNDVKKDSQKRVEYMKWQQEQIELRERAKLEERTKLILGMIKEGLSLDSISRISDVSVDVIMAMGKKASLI